jgi:hypothetical protein
MSRSFACLLAFSSFIFPPLAAAQTHMAWVQRTDVGSPGKRNAAAMAYDEVHEVTLLFGGYLGATSGTHVLVNDLWKYDGVQWTQMTVTGTLPPPMPEASMCFHPGLQRTLLHGTSDAYVEQMMWSFVFDSATSGHWQVESTDGPLCDQVAMVYDYSRQVLVLMGAGSTVYVPGVQTWEWNMAAWTRKADAPYSQSDYAGRPFLPSLGYHAASGKMLLVDDEALTTSGANEVSRVFAFDGTTWTLQALTNGLAPPLGAYFRNRGRKLAYDPSRQRLVAVDSTSSYDFDGTYWRTFGPSLNSPNGPGQANGLTPLRAASVAFDKKRNILVRFGGQDAVSLGASYSSYEETWELRRTNTAIVLVTPVIGIPNPFIKCVNDSLQLHVLVDVGNGPSTHTGIIYEWFKDGLPMPPAPGQSWLYLRDFLTTADTGVYQARCTDTWGNRVESDLLPVHVFDHAQITQQPLGRRLIPGESFALQVAYNSTLPVTVTWTKDNVLIPGANSLIYTRSNVTLADAGEYRATLHSLCSEPISQPAVISVGPRIVTEPSFPANPGAGTAPVSMTVTGDGAGSLTGTYLVGADPTEHALRVAPNDVANPRPMAFTWRFEGTPISNGTKYTITNTSVTSSLQINLPDYEDEGRYDCVVTDASGPAYAKLTQQRELLLQPLAPPYLNVLQSRGPEPRSYSGMVYDSVRRRTVLFGGEAFGVNPRSGNANVGHFSSNDTWEWDGQVWVKRNPVTRPPPTSNFGISFDSTRGRTVIFGGHKDTPPNFQPGFEVITNDVWEWDGTNWTQITPPSSPTARIAPVMCYDGARGEVLMLGGSTFNPEPPDYYGSRKILWGWDGTQWTQRGLVPGGSAEPYIGGGHAFGFDPVRGVAVLFGHFGDNAYPVWEWNGTLWTKVTPPLDVRVIDSRFSPFAFYDPVRRRIGLPIISNNTFPPVGPSVPSMLWWNGTSFIRGDTSTIDDINGTTPAGVDAGPYGQDRDLGAFDTHRRCFVWHDTPQFSNSGPAFTKEMHFSAKARPVHLPLEIFFSPNQTIQLRVISAGQRTLSYQWFKGATALIDDAQYAEVTSGRLTINNITAANAGPYSLRITNAMNQVFTRDVRLTLQPDGVATAVQGAGLVLSWPGATGILESAPAPNGPWTAIYGVSPPYSVAMDEERRFYRVRYP